MNKFKHLIITRFNYPENYPNLKERIDLFNKYTFKGIKDQTNQNFKWIILSNNELNIKNATCMSLGNLHKYIKKLDYEYLITTRLDNDDFLLPEYINSIQAFIGKRILEENPILLIDTLGYRLDERNNAFYKDKLYSNIFSSPFISLIEKKGHELKSHVYTYEHGGMCRRFPSVIVDKILWLQIIHNTNLAMNKDSNHIIAMRGVECNIPEELKELLK